MYSAVFFCRFTLHNGDIILRGEDMPMEDVIFVRCGRELKARLIARAERLGINASELARGFIARELERDELLSAQAAALNGEKCAEQGR
jgi:hypothetical protein